MRILLLTETIPAPLDSGGRIRTFNTIRLLAQAHEVHCHAFIREEGQRRHAAMLAPYCRTVTLHHRPSSLGREAAALSMALAGAPFTLARHFDREAASALSQACERLQIDLVYCDHLSMVQYGQRLGRRFVYDAHNVESVLVARHASRASAWSPVRIAGSVEAARLRRAEARACLDASLVIALSDSDAAGLRTLAPGANVTTVPIAIDVASLDRPRDLVPAPHLLFIGGLHWPPNAQGLEWFVREVWPLVCARLPEARLTIVGRASLAQRAQLERHPGVRALGAVDDLDPVVGQGRALVAPLLAGGGVRVKILDAFARRLPVVATSVGWEGIDAEPGRHLLSADDPGALAGAVQAVLTDDALATRLSENGHALAVERYSLERVGVILLDEMARLR